MKPASVRRSYIIGSVVLAALLTISIGFHFFKPAAPTYQGNSVRFWLAELGDQSSARASKTQNAEVALVAMGTNSLPFILDELRAKDRPRLDKLMNKINRFLWIRLRYSIGYTPSFIRRTGAKQGLCAIAPSLGILGLTNLLNDPNREVCDAAALALSQLHDASSRQDPFMPTRALISALSHTNQFARTAAAARLRDCGFWTPEALPPLLKCLKDSDAELRAEATVTFEWWYRAFYQQSEWASWSDQANVPSVLMHCLQDTNAVIRRSALISLGRTGDRSPEVRAAIIRTRTDKDPTVSEAVERALITLDNVIKRNGPPKAE